jgi:hypothetical protein
MDQLDEADLILHGGQILCSSYVYPALLQSLHYDGLVAYAQPTTNCSCVLAGPSADLADASAGFGEGTN